MNKDLHIQIHDELLVFLNREPSENEIQNGQTDVNIMSKVKDKQQTEEKAAMQTIIDDLSAQVDTLTIAVPVVK